MVLLLVMIEGSRLVALLQILVWSADEEVVRAGLCVPRLADRFCSGDIFGLTLSATKRSGAAGSTNTWEPLKALDPQIVPLLLARVLQDARPK
jgi:hypothetical protein